MKTLQLRLPFPDSLCIVSLKTFSLKQKSYSYLNSECQFFG